MHIITGPNGLVGPAAKHDFACVRAHACVRWTLHGGACNTDYCANIREGGMKRGIDGWKER